MSEFSRTAVGYARTSSRLNPKASIPNQCKLIKEYCENNEICLKEIYIDESKTATTVQGRNGYMKLKSDLEHEDIEIVIVSFFDRLAREAFEFVLTVLDLNKKGIEIVSISEDLSSKRMSPIHLAMIAFEIEYENKQRTERIHGAIKENRKKGAYNLAYVPTGYKKDRNSRLIIDLNESIKVQQIFKLYLKTKSIRKIAENFYGMTEQQIKTILENKTYTGYIFTRDRTEKKLLKFNQQSFIKHPPIIDEEMFEKVRLVREEEMNSVSRNPNKTFLLKSIIRCPTCLLSLRCKKGLYFCLKCKDIKFQQEDIEGKFLLWLNSFLIEKEKRSQENNLFNSEIETILHNRKKLEENFSKAKLSFKKFQADLHVLNLQIKKLNEKKYDSNTFRLKFEFEGLIQNKSWLKLRKRLFEEGIIITIDERHNNFKILNNG